MAIQNIDTNKGVWVMVEGMPGGGFVVVIKVEGQRHVYNEPVELEEALRLANTGAEILGLPGERVLVNMQDVVGQAGRSLACRKLRSIARQIGLKM